MQAGDLHRERLRLQPETRALLAGRVGLVARQFLAHPGAVRLLPAALDVGDDALEGFARRVAAHAVVIGEGDGLAARAEQDRILHLLRQLAPRRLHRHVEVVRDGFERLRVIGRGVAGARPGDDGALAKGERLIGHDKRRLEFQLRAKPIAFRAGAERVVEREQPRLDLVDGEAGDRAGEALRKGDALRIRGLQRSGLPFLFMTLRLFIVMAGLDPAIQGDRLGASFAGLPGQARQ